MPVECPTHGRVLLVPNKRAQAGRLELARSREVPAPAAQRGRSRPKSTATSPTGIVHRMHSCRASLNTWQPWMETRRHYFSAPALQPGMVPGKVVMGWNAVGNRDQVFACLAMWEEVFGLNAS